MPCRSTESCGSHHATRLCDAPSSWDFSNRTRFSPEPCPGSGRASWGCASVAPVSREWPDESVTDVSLPPRHVATRPTARRPLATPFAVDRVAPRTSETLKLIGAADPNAPRVKRLPIESRSAEQQWDLGRAMRKSVPRASFGDWVPAADRPNLTSLITQQNGSRIPELVPVRHSRMLVSPFKFFRGTAVVMAADLARIPSAGIYVQANGDAHLSNFGAFATPERRLAFDLNDFDETHPAPFEWDVMRLAASVTVAA